MSRQECPANIEWYIGQLIFLAYPFMAFGNCLVKVCLATYLYLSLWTMTVIFISFYFLCLNNYFFLHIFLERAKLCFPIPHKFLEFQKYICLWGEFYESQQPVFYLRFQGFTSCRAENWTRVCEATCWKFEKKLIKKSDRGLFVDYF